MLSLPSPTTPPSLETLAQHLSNDVSAAVATPTLLAKCHPNVSVLYADIQGFTKLAQHLKPRQVMRLLNRLYTKVDKLLHVFCVHKVETIGDCYVAAAGLRLDADGVTPGCDSCATE